MSIIKEHVSDVTATAAAGVVWLAAEVVQMPPIIQTLLENSIFAGLVLFFVWTSWQREAKLVGRIIYLDAELSKLMERTLIALERQNDLTKDLAAAITSLESTVKNDQQSQGSRLKAQ